MRAIDRFRCVPLSEPNAHKSQLWADGQALDTRILGTYLEAQYELPAVGGARYLLLTSYDCPFEESLFIHLLGEDAKQLEHRELGAPYVPGILEDVRVLADDTLRFDFQGPKIVRVHAAPRGLWRRRLQLQRA